MHIKKFQAVLSVPVGIETKRRLEQIAEEQNQSLADVVRDIIGKELGK